MNHNKEQLEQSLLELHYGLLDDAEASELRALIATDADVAALWANTLSMAGQFADAAKLAGTPDIEDANVSTDGSSILENRDRPPIVNPIREQLIGKKHPPEMNNRALNAELNAALPKVQANKELASDSKSEFAQRAFEKSKRSHRSLTRVVAGLAAAMFLAVSANYWLSLPASPSTAIRVDVQTATNDGVSRNSFEFVTSRMASQAAESLTGVSANLLVTVKIGSAVIHTDKVATNEAGRAVYLGSGIVEIAQGRDAQCYDAVR